MAASPRFSVLIPTRERPSTFGAALDSVMSQPFGDVEVVVMDNCSGPQTRALVDQAREAAGGRPHQLRYHRSDRVLPMRDNWELGLSLCTGEYVFVLGDDDALMPDGLVLADQILSRFHFELLHWDKFGYWWLDALDEEARGRLLVHTNHEVQVLDCRQALAAFYAWKITYAPLPCIYSSLVHRDVIARVKALAGGKYFAAGSPDIYTGIANAYVTPQALHCRRGLSISGNSGQSTGSAHFHRSKGHARRDAFWKDEGAPQPNALHPKLIDCPNIELGVADSQLWAKDILFPNDDRLQLISIPQLLSCMIAGLARDPESYEDAAADIRALAAKYDINPASLSIPRPPPKPRGSQQGLFDSGIPGKPNLAVNCGPAGIKDAAAAARLALGLLPVVSYAA